MHRSINKLLGVLLFANNGPGLFAKGVIARGLLLRGLLLGGHSLHATSVAFFRGGSLVFPTVLIDLMKTHFLFWCHPNQSIVPGDYMYWWMVVCWPLIEPGFSSDFFASTHL